MLQILSVMILLIFLNACTATSKSISEKEHTIKVQKKIIQHKRRYQSVDEKDAILVQKGKTKYSCAVCGMHLVAFYKTNHVANENGVEKQYCSIHCLANSLADGAQLKNPMVVDSENLNLIPVLEAYYVVGSKIKGTMSKVSKYAFSSLDDAKSFQKKYGGEIMDFRAALEKAKEDF